MPYCLPKHYRSRTACNAHLTTTDGAQTRVYRFAADLVATDPNVRTVLDWGCGTGYKLINYFGLLDTLGVDVDYRLPALQARYPRRRWAVCPVPAVADLILCVDVIEHVDDPAKLLHAFAAGQWRHLVISTPERELVARRKYRDASARQRQRSGPPCNRWHAREWTSIEFSAFVLQQLGICPEIQIIGRWNLVAHVRRS